MTFFGLKLGMDLENRVAQPHQEFPGVPTGELVPGYKERRKKNACADEFQITPHSYIMKRRKK